MTDDWAGRAERLLAWHKMEAFPTAPSRRWVMSRDVVAAICAYAGTAWDGTTSLQLWGYPVQVVRGRRRLAVVPVNWEVLTA